VRRFVNALPMLLAGGFVLGIALWIAFVIRHPCIRSESYACTRTYCSMYMPSPDPALATMCVVWTTEPDTCTRCLERAP